MLKNQNEITTYTNNNKVYIPSTFKNSNYKYRLYSDYITIITNNNCYQNYNSTYCTCYNYYYDINIVTDSFECSYSTNTTNFINYNSLSSDVNDSPRVQRDYFNDKFLMFGIIIIALLFFISLRKGYRYK